MSRLHELARLRPSTVAAAYLGDSPRLILLTCGLVTAVRLPPSWLGHAPAIVLALLLLGGLLGPIYIWTSRRCVITGTGFTEVRGLFRVQTRCLAWRDISTVEVRAHWSSRPFGLRSVTLGTDGAAESTIRLAGVSAAESEEIARRARHGEDVLPVGQEPDPEPQNLPESPRDGGLIHRSSPTDLVLSSLCYGQAVVLAGAILGAVVQLVELTGHSTEVVQALAARPGLTLAAFGLAGLGVGAVLTAVRFHGLTASVIDGTVVLRHGLVSTTTRAIRPDEVTGLQVRRNLVELLLDRARVSLITTDSSQQWDGNLALPSLPRRRMLPLLERLAPGSKVPACLRTPGRTALPVSLALTLVPVAAGVAAALGAAQWWHGRPLPVGIAGLGVLVVTLVLARGCAARLDLTDAGADVVVWRIAVGGQTVRLLRTSAVHLMSTARIPVHRSLELITLHYHSGRPRACPALTTAPEDSETITRAMAETGPRTAAHRRRGKAAPCSPSTD